MYIFYVFSLFLYKIALVLASPFNVKAKQMLQGRKGLFKDLEKQDLKDCFWLHAASLGEFEQGRPVIEAYKEKYPNAKIVVSFFSPSGYEIRKNYAAADYVCYLPFDSKRNAKRFISAIQPKVVLFVKYEYWYHFLKQLNVRKVPTFLISAIFRPNQLFFKPYGKWYLNILRFFEHIFVQDISSKNLLEEHGIKQTQQVGDTRFDRVRQIVAEARALPQFDAYTKERKSLVAGSTWPKDEELLAVYLETNPKLCVVLAPHEIHEAHLDQIKKTFKDKCIFYSEVGGGEIPRDKQVVVVDSIGLLSSLYRYGNIAYIGGGFGVGIHNTLEAASYGMPVLFGPNYVKFKEARDLIECGGSFSISNFETLKRELDRLINDDKQCINAASEAHSYVLRSKGATSLILAHISV